MEQLLDFLEQLFSLVSDLLLDLDFRSLELEGGLAEHADSPAKLFLLKIELVYHCFSLCLLALE